MAVLQNLMMVMKSLSGNDKDAAVEAGFFWSISGRQADDPFISAITQLMMVLMRLAAGWIFI